MQKVSAEQMHEVLAEAPRVIRSLTEERDTAVAKLAAVERRQSAEKLAAEMHSKGMEVDVPSEELADRLEKAAEKGKFEVIQEAVSYAGPDMGSKLASLGDDDARSNPGSSHLEQFIVGGIG